DGGLSGVVGPRRVGRPHQHAVRYALDVVVLVVVADGDGRAVRPRGYGDVVLVECGEEGAGEVGDDGLGLDGLRAGELPAEGVQVTVVRTQQVALFRRNGRVHGGGNGEAEPVHDGVP